MGFFEDRRKNSADVVYSSAKAHLKPKDGHIHVILFEGYSSFTGQAGLDCDKRYTDEIDEILTKMQDDGYQIIDVKILLDQRGLSGTRNGFYTLVLYK